MDIDLENGVNPTYMAQALEQLQSDVGSSLIITLAPQTIDTQSTASDYLALALNIKPILTMINTQYYNSGTMNGCDGNVYAEGSVDFITALACTELQSGLSAAQIGIGLPASPASQFPHWPCSQIGPPAAHLRPWTRRCPRRWSGR